MIWNAIKDNLSLKRISLLFYSILFLFYNKTTHPCCQKTKLNTIMPVLVSVELWRGRDCRQAGLFKIWSWFERKPRLCQIKSILFRQNRNVSKNSCSRLICPEKVDRAEIEITRPPRSTISTPGAWPTRRSGARNQILNEMNRPAAAKIDLRVATNSSWTSHY